MPIRSARRHHILPLLLAAVALFAVAGCFDGGKALTNALSGGEDRPVAITPADQSTRVRPDAPIRVRAASGELREVAVVDEAGNTIEGKLSADRSSWTSHAGKHLSSWYIVTVRSVDGEGDEAYTQSSFRTLKSKQRLAARIAPLSGETVGVGMPIAVYFTAPVEDRAAVERRFHVSDEKDRVGAWHWYSDTEMHYRPRQFWPAHDEVRLRYDIHGLNVGKGVWGDDGRTIRFSIGAAHVSKVDARAHSMKVYDGGKLVKTLAVSTGRDKYPTSSGVHVVSEKTADKIMDSATVGIPRDSPDGYYEHVPWSVRISNSGEFVHAASWSVSDQGVRNVSHGCVNLSPAGGEWFFNFARRGDLVDVVGTPIRLQQGNGFADWNLSWKEWLAGSALSG